ncbi:MAG: AAA family ATPase [Burkholderiales bacterium]|nr:AAA family ATPase [Burkholderiales bacterium]
MTGPTDEGFDPDPDTEGGGGRRRYLTVLFSDLSDSTRLGELMEAEPYAEMLGRFRRLCRETVARHGGHIARIQGDGVLAFFGYPKTQEDDGRRATEAALDLHAAVRRMAVGGAEPTAPLTLHSGIHAGLVYLADGDVERGRFELLGNVPNIAARLSGLAASDDICVSAETLGPRAQYFTTSERALVQLRGRTLPLAVYRVLGRAPAPYRSEATPWRGLCPFVGREPELRLLRGHLRRAIAGTIQCVGLSGGPGVGKTRLIEELRRYAVAGECLVLQGYCESYLSAEPLQPFLQMLRALLGSATGGQPAAVASAGGAELADNAIDTAEAEIDSEADRQLRAALERARPLIAAGGAAQPLAIGGAVATLRGLFDALALQQPLLLVVDDWQWADEASQQVLDAVLSLRRPILVVVATRASISDGLLVAPTATIDLRPLDDAQAARAMEHLLPGADPFVVAEIHRYAGGIPLFIEELCHSASAQGAGWLKELRLGSTAWLTALIESRVARLPPAQAELVRAAAVVGNVFPAWLLERITGHGARDPLMLALAEQDFIFPAELPGTLRFKHGITRDVVYEAVGLHQRKDMHRRIAQALEVPGDAVLPEDRYEALAYHCAAGDLPEAAARYAELAGDKAMAASALDRARHQYAAALKALDGTAPLTRELALRWCAIAQKLGLACVFDPLGLADGVTIFERGLALARYSGSMAATARAEYWLGYICYAKGLARAAVTHCEAALDLATLIDDARLAAQVRATLGQALLAGGDHERALALLDAAVDSKRRQSRPGSSLAVGSAYTLACKGYLLGDLGRFAQADECFAEALHLVGDAVHQVGSSVRHWISVVYQWQGRWEEALRRAEEASEIAVHVKSRQQLAMGRALAGYARWTLTREPEALQAVREATAWIEAREGGLATSLNHGWLVDGAVATGRLDEARRHAARLFGRARQHDRLGEALGCRALARAAAKANDFARADHYLRLALRSAQARDSAHELASTQLCQAQIELDRGRVGQAHALLDLACSAFERLDMRWHLERARRTRATL